MKTSYKVKETNIIKLKAFLKDVSKHKRNNNTSRSNDCSPVNNVNRFNREESQYSNAISNYSVYITKNVYDYRRKKRKEKTKKINPKKKTL